MYEIVHWQRCFAFAFWDSFTKSELFLIYCENCSFSSSVTLDVKESTRKMLAQVYSVARKQEGYLVVYLVYCQTCIKQTPPGNAVISA